MKRQLYAVTVLAIVALLVLAPSLYIIWFTVADLRATIEIFTNAVAASGYREIIFRSLSLSFRLAIAVAIIDLLIGIPIAYAIARNRLKPGWLIEDIITLPLVVPTSAFGFAILLAWSSPGGLPSLLGLERVSQQTIVPVFNVPALLLITHVALTIPYMVRPLTAVLRSLGDTYEVISRTLKASPLTTFRRITIPLSISSIVSSLVLAITRSLGETGASLIVAGVSFTASIAIVRLFYDFKVGLASLLSTLLILLSLAIVLPTEALSKKLLVSRRYKRSNLESKISKIESIISGKRIIVLARDVVLYLLVLLIIVAPLFFIFKALPEYWEKDPFSGKIEGGVLYQVFGPSGYWHSILSSTINSFIVASLSTLAALYISILLFTAIRETSIEYLVRGLIRIPLVVPTSALGLSALLLFGEHGLGILSPGIWLTTIVHTSFSVPIIFETIMSTYETIQVKILEETARTLGASPLDAVETITLPLMKKGIIAGSLLAFTHSMGETGATIIVMGKDVTVPVLVVHMAEALAVPAALFTSVYLLGLALIFLAITRLGSK
ncbi:MAG: hypothetical protein DRJ35_04760 [Thermoprotei archaeon]|nr:MAG: hypothetical protein DRJ35_04760 [Thermoprotei archaeon]